MSAAGETAELTIDALAAGGDGVGRDASGRVVFVPFTVPGDRVVVTIESGKKRFARGRVQTLLAAGPARTDPPCAVFGACGGCAWQHVTYGAQVEAKRAILRDALIRIGGFAAPRELSVAACPAPYGYRSRTRVLVERGRVGYRHRHSSALCPTSRCPILVPALEGALAAFAARAPDEDGEWELAAGADGAVCITRVGAAGASRLVLLAGGERIERTAGGFAQANAPLLDALVLAVRREAGEGDRVLELFAGAGFLTLALARRFSSVVAVEGDTVAAADLSHNLAAAGLHHVDVRAEPAERALASIRAPIDAVVLDPPRAGLPRGAAARIAALGARRIVYLSCDAATLARDLAEMARAGYALVRAQGFDAFPQTPHVEALATLVAR